MNDLVEDDPVKTHLRAAGRKGLESRWGNPEQRKLTAARRLELDQQLVSLVSELRNELAELRAERVAA